MKNTFFRRLLPGAAMFATLAIGAFAQQTTPTTPPTTAPPNSDVQADKKDIKNDRKDIRADTKDIRKDKRDINSDKKDIHSDVKDVRKDQDRKSTRLNSSHQIISYAVFCLKKKNK